MNKLNIDYKAKMLISSSQLLFFFRAVQSSYGESLYTFFFHASFIEREMPPLCVNGKLNYFLHSLRLFFSLKDLFIVFR